MRELKFRAWSLERKCYVDVWEITFDDEGLPGVLSFEYNGLLYKEPAHNFIIEQDTGLKDKNGKEIREGDILWWEHYYGMTGECKEYTERVYWEEKDAGYVVGDWFEPLGSLVYEDEVEVIGNIHENPELINTKATVGVKKSYTKPTSEEIEKTLKEMKLRNWGQA